MTRSPRPCAAALRLAAAAAVMTVMTARAGAAGPARAAAPAVTLEQIMAAPDWIGNPPENPYWSDDGRAVYYERKRPAEELRDLVRLDLATGAARVVPPAEKGTADAPGGDWSLDRRRKVYARYGDIYLKDAATGAVRQLTRTAEAETEPRFLARRPPRLVPPRRRLLRLRPRLRPGLAAGRRCGSRRTPRTRTTASFLKAQQLRLFDVMRKQQERPRRWRARRTAPSSGPIPARPPLPLYLGTRSRSSTPPCPRAATGCCWSTTPVPAKDADDPKTMLPNTSPRAATSRPRRAPQGGRREAGRALADAPRPPRPRALDLDPAGCPASSTIR